MKEIREELMKIQVETAKFIVSLPKIPHPLGYTMNSSDARAEELAIIIQRLANVVDKLIPEDEK